MKITFDINSLSEEVRRFYQLLRNRKCPSLGFLRFAERNQITAVQIHNLFDAITQYYFKKSTVAAEKLTQQQIDSFIAAHLRISAYDIARFRKAQAASQLRSCPSQPHVFDNASQQRITSLEMRVAELESRLSKLQYLEIEVAQLKNSSTAEQRPMSPTYSPYAPSHHDYSDGYGNHY